ncbi:hypothetical protein QO002_001862 [Pararhizobium capsulatum DSM 1112]|uniref:Uncharacterized protein n=1 Tax=Pararhizobium capsulatum DSM 1112 TaxID=1121113 RepID=A0ABU0BN98_9HYPH|nr:hypothetical protein [Pararhizobium capsulatum]MDQ0319724.1 hypothetical protein [Pararhizobium capsulatum DSM 1112]
MKRQTTANRPLAAGLSALLLATVALVPFFPSSPAFALSELKRVPGDAQDVEPVPGETQDEPPAADPEQGVAPLQIPMPDPLVQKPTTDTKDDALDDEPPAAPVEVLSDVSKIPAPVARMRELIVEAAASGDIERLRPLLGKGPTQTQVGDGQDDPIATLKGLSGDGEGVEILAILLDLLSTGFVNIDKGTPDEMYVWPYFAEKPLDSLTPPEKVDLFRLVTAGDYAGMEEFGGYNFYRIGITPDGQWKFFTGGD